MDDLSSRPTIRPLADWDTADLERAYRLLVAAGHQHRRSGDETAERQVGSDAENFGLELARRGVI